MEMLYNILHRTPLENAYFRACLAAHPIYLEAFRYATFVLQNICAKKINEYPFLVGICNMVHNKFNDLLKKHNEEGEMST